VHKEKVVLVKEITEEVIVRKERGNNLSKGKKIE
jgi:hypothetical protein